MLQLLKNNGFRLSPEWQKNILGDFLRSHRNYKIDRKMRRVGGRRMYIFFIHKIRKKISGRGRPMTGERSVEYAVIGRKLVNS